MTSKLIWKRFRHRGKKYRLRPAGIETIRLLREVASNSPPPGGLLALRPRIREALRVPCTVALSYIVDHTSNARVLRLAIWMLGRIGNPYATSSILHWASHPSFRVRREVIRSLHRLHAWTSLSSLAANHEDPRTRAIAEVKPTRPYQERLARFVERAEVLETPQSHGELVIDPAVEIGEGLPPKSRWRIARVLRRIHRLVRRARRKRRRLMPDYRVSWFSRAL